MQDKSRINRRVRPTVFFCLLKPCEPFNDRPAAKPHVVGCFLRAVDRIHDGEGYLGLPLRFLTKWKFPQEWRTVCRLVDVDRRSGLTCCPDRRLPPAFLNRNCAAQNSTIWSEGDFKYWTAARRISPWKSSIQPFPFFNIMEL